MSAMKYCEYFDIDEAYFPCIDASAINAGIDWKKTYPHGTFIKLLKNVESMLGGMTKRSIWIHGAYGTGKSQCAYALKKILEVSEDELKEYWNTYDSLKKEMPLLGKIIGHKEKKILTAFRYASGNIRSPQQLFMAIQESIKLALEENNITYKGEDTLKESVIKWMENSAQKQFIDNLLEKPEWKSAFSQSTADDVIDDLKNITDVSQLMNNIFRMAAKEGITALDLDADHLRNWIKDIIEKNKIKIVLIWDEFSDFFRPNKNSLGEFQKVVSICEELPFYLIVVTHPISSIVSDDDSWKIVQQRFDRVEIELPDNIAFNLIGHAFSVKEAARSQWEKMTEDLGKSLVGSTNAVMKQARINDITVMQRILPIHPMAALLLKNIASAFQANQRSIFDFIKTSHDMDVKAFQWFIREYGPMNDAPFLTVDMLWDFFYVKGREYLTPDIRLILDTFPQQTSLNENEEKVLKAILIMQAIDQRLGGTLPILKPTDQNISYVFEGIAEYEETAKNIAKGLERKGILITTQIGGGQKMYGAAVLAGGHAKIETIKNEIRKQSTTSKLVQDGEQIGTSLALTPALKLHFFRDTHTGTVPIVTSSDFKRIMDQLKTADIPWQFYAVLALAKDEVEAQSFRAMIKSTIENVEYKNIIVIDALSSPLGCELLEQYVDHRAMSSYYQGNNNQQATEYSRKSKDILNRVWRDKISAGQFYIRTYKNPEGEKAMGANDVHIILKTIVLTKFPHVQDFTRGLTESQLRLTAAKPIAKQGMGDSDVKGLISGCENSILRSTWNKDNYWNIQEYQRESIVIIKKDIDKLIAEAFEKDGKIPIDDIYYKLEDEYGFAPCNLSAFLTGFLLKEYRSDPYRCINAEGYTDTMTPDKLAEMISNCMSRKSKATYIVKMTPEEKSFYNFTAQAWDVPTSTCSSPKQVCECIRRKMSELSYPVWCLKYVDNGAFDIVKKYIELVQSDGNHTHDKAIEIGKYALQRPNKARDVKTLITSDKCKAGILEFLNLPENEKLLSLADEIGNNENILLSDIKKIFSEVKYSAIWVEETGKAELRRLLIEYETIKCTNELLNGHCHTKEQMINAWQETLKFVGFSCDALKSRRSELDKILGYLKKVNNGENIIPEMEDFLSELQNHKEDIRNMINNSLDIFNDLYGVYLEGFSVDEKDEIKKSIPEDMFRLGSTVGNQKVKQAADDYRRKQLKTQLYKLWRDKTGTDSPKKWSLKFKTPILCLIQDSDYEKAKNVFDTLNSSYASDTDIRKAIDFIKDNDELFEKLKDIGYVNEMFMRKIVGDYSTLLSDINDIRLKLEGLHEVEVYGWYDNPLVKQKILDMAQAEYYAGGSLKATKIIDEMNDAELKLKLKELVQKDIEFGLKLIKNGGR